MQFKKILLMVVVSSLLIGCVCAASVSDFKVDDTYKNVYSGEYYSVYATNDSSSGISIYKNVDDDVYDDMENDDILDNIIHHDGREYITPDDDLTLNKSSDNTANFTDMEHSTIGASEVVDAGGEQFIVVAWAQNSNNATPEKVVSTLLDFNKDNNLTPVAF